jgi:Tat protein translocase TatC
MTYGEHLEELRRRLLVGILAFAIAFVAAFAFQERLMDFFTRPFERARAAINEEILGDWAASQRRLVGPERADLPLIEVIEALAGAVARGLPPEEVEKLRERVAKLRERSPPQLGPLQAIGAVEKFKAYMMECLLVALLVSAPVLLFEIWRFVAAGLYLHERRVVLRVLPWSLLLFFVGLAFGYFVLAELSVRFLVGYGSFEHVVPQVTVASYLGLLFFLLLVMGLVFQIPLFMTVLTSVGIAGPDFFRAKRRHFILAIFVVAAIITPPDYISQLLVAGPMLVLFEIGIWLSKGAARRRRARTEGGGAEPTSR